MILGLLYVKGWLPSEDQSDEEQIVTDNTLIVKRYAHDVK